MARLPRVRGASLDLKACRRDAIAILFESYGIAVPAALRADLERLCRSIWTAPDTEAGRRSIVTQLTSFGSNWDLYLEAATNAVAHAAFLSGESADRVIQTMLALGGAIESAAGLDVTMPHRSAA